MPLSVLSIIICTKNRPNDLKITLGSVFQQSFLPDSVVIVDDSTSDDTEILVRDYAASTPVNLIYSHSPRPHSGLPAARNTGIKKIPDITEIILFLDDDVTLEKQYPRVNRIGFFPLPRNIRDHWLYPNRVPFTISI